MKNLVLIGAFAGSLFALGASAAAQAQSATPAQAQTAPAQSGAQMPMGQMMGQGMMQGSGTPGGMMSGGMMGGHGSGMMGRLSSEDMSAFLDAHIAAVHAGLKLSAEQEQLWPPVEGAIRNLATLHMSHRRAMRESRGAMAGDRVAMIRGMADRMSQGADALRQLADAAAPLYATLDDAQKRRLQFLAPMGPRGLLGPGGMRGFGGATMGGWPNDEDDEDDH